MGLPVDRRLRRGSDITSAIRQGSRARSGGLVVHGLPRPVSSSGLLGPRIAFVAPRSVGTAVVRNRTRRRLQAHLTDLVREGALDAEVDLVVRLLPASTTSDSAELGRRLRAALVRLGMLAA